MANLIQDVSIWGPGTGAGELGPDPQQFELLQDFLRVASRLRSIETKTSDADTLSLVHEICAKKVPVRLKLDRKMLGRDYTGTLIEELSALQTITEGSIISLNMNSFTQSFLLDDLKHLLVSTCLRALTVCRSARREYQVGEFPKFFYFPFLCAGVQSSSCIRGLEEFHTGDGTTDDEDINHEDRMETHSILRHISFRKLRRLSLSGPAVVGNLLPFIAWQLVSLQALRLNTSCQRSYSGIAKLTTPKMPPSLTSTSRDNPYWQTPSSLLTRLPCLKELTMDGASKDVPVEAFATAQLEHLRLHMRDTYSSHRSRGQRTAADIRHLSALSPNIRRFELDIGDLSTLWDGSAIPGVDVDVTTYDMLRAICSFPKLQYLRLYPRYVEQRNGPFDEVVPRQPLSDEQAVRLFRRLKSDRPCLQILSITADPFCISPRDGFRCMNWLVTQRGQYTVLRTRQQTKSYEQEQIWEGERRLRMQIKHDRFPKPYHTEKSGWTFDYTYPEKASTSRWGRQDPEAYLAWS